MTVQQWATTAADNNSSPPTGAPEGMAPSAVNNTMREMMASVAVEAQINRVKVLGGPVAGTNTITGTMTPALTAYSAGMLVVFTPAANNTGAATLNINSLGALDIQKADGDALVSGDLVAGIPALLMLDSGADDWILLNPQNLNIPELRLTKNAASLWLIQSDASANNGKWLIDQDNEELALLAVNDAENSFTTLLRFSRTGVITTANSSAAETGFKGIPQNVQNGNYTCVLADAGKQIYSQGAGPYTWTIPANASVAFPVGTVLTFVNFTSNNVTIAITSDTLTLAGAGSTGSRTLASNGIASAVKINSTNWCISGTGLS